MLRKLDLGTRAESGYITVKVLEERDSAIVEVHVEIQKRG